MKQEHLSSWQIEELIIAGRITEAPETGNAAMRHLEACELCKASRDQLQEFIDLYRDSALVQTNAAESQSRTFSYPAPQPYWSLWRMATLGLAFILLVAVFVPVLLQQQRVERRQQQQRRTAAQMATDDLLLQKIDEEVTYSVPQPLQSLTDPVADAGSKNE
jgi:hypothetical protein